MRFLAIALGSALVFAAGTDAQEELFVQGNRHYQGGDFEAAIEAYETILSAGYESAPIHYNLGNAYFKAGDLGRAILSWERSRALSPSDPDVEANLTLASSLTVDDVQPLPRFWLVSVIVWWVDLLPQPVLIGSVSVAWLSLAGGLAVWIVAYRSWLRRLGARIAIASGIAVLVLGSSLLARELEIGTVERGVILSAVVPVRSAPTEDDNLTLFEVHEGARVRVDQRTGAWAEIVLEDGKVGWVPAETIGII